MEYEYNFSPTEWDLDHLIPFAATSETASGIELCSVDLKEEMVATRKDLSYIRSSRRALVKGQKAEFDVAPLASQSTLLASFKKRANIKFQTIQIVISIQVIISSVFS